MDKKKYFIIAGIVIFLLIIIGGTYAYWSWSTSNAQATAVTFTVGSNFSCSADGGGNITSNDLALAPAACTNTNYAIKRTVTVGPTINAANTSVYLDMWLKVNSIGSGLSSTSNFKYALTTSPTNCTTGVVAEGNFQGATTNTEKKLLDSKTYSETMTDTYYLWIWLDAAETSSSSQNQTFNISLGGSCTDNSPFTYTVNVQDESNENATTVRRNNAIPSTITTYTTPSDAMDAFEAAVNNGNRYQFYLKHNLTNNLVTKSYVEFIITSAMAQANSGMTAGTYYLEGGSGSSYSRNVNTIETAFGVSNCSEYSTSVSCEAGDLSTEVSTYGDAYIVATAGYDYVAACGVYGDSTAFCTIVE